MRFRVFVLTLITMTVTNVFGLDYSNEEYGIHFVLPDHWRIVDFEDLRLESQQTLGQRYHPFKTLSIGGIRGHDGLVLTEIIIQYRPFEKSNFEKAKIFIRSDDAKKRMITSAEITAGDAAGREIKHYKITKTECDFIGSANRLYGIVHYEYKDNQKIVAMVVKFLCKDGWVNLICFSRNSEAEGFVDVVNSIADSFQYDNNTSLEKDVKSKEVVDSISFDQDAESKKETFIRLWKWSGTILGVLIVLGILKSIFGR